MKTGNRSYLSMSFIQLKVDGVFPEEFINRAAQRAILIENLHADGRSLTLTTNNPGLKKLQEMAAEQGFTLTICQETGWFFRLRRFWRRKTFIIGLVAFCWALYFLSGRIWTIELNGLVSIQRDQVLDFVQSYGLELWGGSRGLDLNAIEEGLYLKFPQLAWVAVDREGVKVSINIEEKNDNPYKRGAIIDIVAAYDGIIFEMMVLKGVPQVGLGATVARGDLLIAGYFDGDDPVHAAGMVKAKVFIEGFGEAGVEETEKRYTGNLQQEELLRLWGKDFRLSSPPNFENYEVEETTVKLFGEAVLLVQRCYREVVFDTKQYSPLEADALARQRALLAAHDQLAEGVKILHKEIKNVTAAALRYRYRVVLTVETNIGCERLQIREE